MNSKRSTGPFGTRLIGDMAGRIQSRIDDSSLKQYAQGVRSLLPLGGTSDSGASRALQRQVRDRVAVVTGASSGIGQALALRLGGAGARVILVARGADKLEAVRDEIVALGGEAHCYPCDLSDVDACGELAQRIVKDHGEVHILVNNAGRSIRRSLKLTYDRFHDFERTMQLNYFGPVRLIMGLLPAMSAQRQGHVINISSIAVNAGAMPRFSAYAASKSALDVFSRCAGAEFRHENVRFTNIHMPLVRTPMIGPTSIYDSVPTLTPEQAVDLIERAIVRQPREINNLTGAAIKTLGLVSPDAVERLMNVVYKVFPDSAAAKGEQGGRRKHSRASAEQVALATVLSGAHV